MATQDLMTRREVADMLRVSLRTLDRIVADGEIVAARVGGRRLLFRRSNVEAYVDRQFADAAR